MRPRPTGHKGRPREKWHKTHVRRVASHVCTGKTAPVRSPRAHTHIHTHSINVTDSRAILCKNRRDPAVAARFINLFWHTGVERNQSSFTRETERERERYGRQVVKSARRLITKIRHILIKQWNAASAVRFVFVAQLFGLVASVLGDRDALHGACAFSEIVRQISRVRYADFGGNLRNVATMMSSTKLCVTWRCARVPTL